MKTFFKVFIRTILYSLPVLLFYGYLEFRLSKLENSYSNKIKNFEKVKARCDVLILGNSQMLKGVNPSLISKNAFNMAQVSQTLSVDKAILEQFITKMPHLKVVVLGIGYTSFGEELENGQEAWRLSFYKSHYGLDLNSNFEAKDYSYTLRYQAYEALKLCFKNFEVDLTKGYQSNGWLRMEGANHAKLSDNWAIIRARSHTKSLSHSGCLKNKQALIDLINMAAKHGVSIVLVKPPIMEKYSKAFDLAWLNRNDSMLSVIKKETGLAVQLMNYSVNKIGFNDVDHLNEEGAKAFSTKIAEAIKNQK